MKAVADVIAIDRRRLLTAGTAAFCLSFAASTGLFLVVLSQ